MEWDRAELNHLLTPYILHLVINSKTALNFLYITLHRKFTSYLVLFTKSLSDLSGVQVHQLLTHYCITLFTCCFSKNKISKWCLICFSFPPPLHSKSTSYNLYFSLIVMLRFLWSCIHHNVLKYC